VQTGKVDFGLFDKLCAPLVKAFESQPKGRR
jgi:hypothetical protein